MRKVQSTSSCFKMEILSYNSSGWLQVIFPFGTEDQVERRQGPRFSIRMVIGIFCSDTVFVQLNQFSQILSRQCCLPTSPLDHPDSEIHQYCSDNVVQILYIFCTYIAHILYRYCTYIAY